MDISLALTTGSSVQVTCDDQPSHVFDLLSLLPALEVDGQFAPTNEAIKKYGEKLYQALFPLGSADFAALQKLSLGDRITLTTSDSQLKAIPWEYIYCKPDDYFLVTSYVWVRTLPPEQRIAPPTLEGGVHILAIPSNPIDEKIPPLNIAGEWQRLREIIGKIDKAVILERVHPPTIEQLGNLLGGATQRIVHFMGHGVPSEIEAQLLFEDEKGRPNLVSARNLLQRLNRRVFLVNLNACVSAVVGQTRFANLAEFLISQKIPYALGMQFTIPDQEALILSRVFYGQMARGETVEEALLQARLAIVEQSKMLWVLAVPVLYTCLTEAASGFKAQEGQPRILEHQPKMELIAIPRAEGTFQGRKDKLIQLGERLTGDTRARLLTIHGLGGQGKTALSREAVERFAWAWQGGVVALSLENIATRTELVINLARFFNLDLQQDPQVIEQQTVQALSQQRTLIVLDNAETLKHKLEQTPPDPNAVQMAQFLREQIPGTLASLLVTSREFLGWANEEIIDLTGLSDVDGAKLFIEYAPQRPEDIPPELAKKLSQKVEGHPLSLRLLGGAFNAAHGTDLATFLADYENRLRTATNPANRDRHVSLFPAIETSVRYLPDDLRGALAGLWIFHAPFMPETAEAIFDPDTDYPEGEKAPIFGQLGELWARGLLVRLNPTLQDGTFLFYQLLPTVRLYVADEMKATLPKEELLQRFGRAYAGVVRFINNQLNKGSLGAFLALLQREDIERAAAYLEPESEDLGWYWARWGWVTARVGDRGRGKTLTEQALDLAEGRFSHLEGYTLNNLAQTYSSTGYPRQALELYDRSLILVQAAGDQTNEAATLNNIGGVWSDLGEKQKALEFFQQALPLRRAVGDRAGEAATLNNIGGVWSDLGEKQKALEFYQQALPLQRAVGDRAGEANTLNNIGGVWSDLGEKQKALEFYQQALPLRRAVGDRAGEAATLNNIGFVWDALGEKQKALEFYQQALPLQRAVGDRAGEAATLNNIGAVWSALGEKQKALEFYQQALPLRRAVGDRAGEAATLNNIGRVWSDLGEKQKALEFYQQALPLQRAVGDRAGEANTLNNIGGVWSDLGEKQKALEFYQQALPLQRAVGDRAGEANTLNNIGAVWSDLGEKQKALEFYQQALPLQRAVGDRAGEAATLNNIGRVWSDLGEKQKALEFFQQALPLRRAVGDRAGEANTLNNIGAVWSDLGEKQKALEFYQQALPLRRAVGDRAGEAATLNNIGGVWSDLGEKQKALEFYQQALPLQRAVGDRAGEANTLNNIGAVWSDLGEKQKALEFYQQALPLRRAVGDRAGEAATLNNIGFVWDALGEKQKALEFYQQALPLQRAVGDRAGEAATLNNIGRVWDALGEKQKALEFYQQALPLQRAVGDRAGEANTLNNIGAVWSDLGEKQKALEFYQQALPLQRAVGDRAGEANTLNNIGAVWSDLGEKQKALEFYQQALPLQRAVGDRAGEAVTCFNIGMIYANEGDLDRAIEYIERCVMLDEQVQHPDLASDRRMLEQLKQLRAGGGTSLPSQTMPAQQLEAIISNTIAVMTTHVDKKAEWRGQIEGAKNQAQNGNMANELAFFAAILALLDGETATLANDHAYGKAWERIQAGIAAGGDTSPQTMPEEQIRIIVSNTIAVMTTHAEKKSEWRTVMDSDLRGAQSKGNDWQIEVELYTAILALLDGETATLAGDHPYSQAWERIQAGIASGGDTSPQTMPSQQLDAIISNTIAVMTTHAEKKAEWRGQIEGAKNQAQNGSMANELAFFAAILALLDGETATLANDHAYGKAWERIQAGIAAGGDTSPQTMPEEQIRIIVSNTIAVMTTHAEKKSEWRTVMDSDLRGAQSKGNDWQIEVELYTAILALLDGETATLAGDHPYSQAWERIQAGIASGGDTSPQTMPSQQLDAIISNTIAVMTTHAEKKAEWRGQIEGAKNQAQNGSMANELAFFVAILALLDGETTTLASDHPYSQAWEQIQAGIAAEGEEPDEDAAKPIEIIQELLNASDLAAMKGIIQTHQTVLFSPETQIIFAGLSQQMAQAGQPQIAQLLQDRFSIVRACQAEGIEVVFAKLAGVEPPPPTNPNPLADLIPSAIAALRGAPPEKMAFYNQLETLSTSDEGMKAFLEVVKAALFTADPQNTDSSSLQGEYAQAWQHILAGVNS